MIIAKPNDKIKLRIVNGGSNGVALHTHGHKASATHFDGIEVPANNQIMRDVFWIASAQRLDVSLEMTDDGLHSYGEGVWLLHDHQGKAVTNNGIGPGGNISAIVYESYLQDNGWPKTFGVSWDPYFSAAYYRREIPIWQSYAENLSSDVRNDAALMVRLLIMAIAASIISALLYIRIKTRNSW
jgi:hypothetical protein